MPAVVIQLITGFDDASVGALERFVPHLSEPGRRFAMGRPAGELRAMRVAQLLCLATHVGGDLGSVFIEAEASGRPVACDSAVHMSVSHAARTLAVAFSDAPIGIDIEFQRRRDEGVMRRLFSADEMRTVSDDDGFTHLWVRKEAYGKWTGVGLGEYLATGEYRTRVASVRQGDLFVGIAGEVDQPIEVRSTEQLLSAGRL